MFPLKALILLVFPILGHCENGYRGKIDPRLLDNSGGDVFSVIITFTQGTEGVLQAIEASGFKSRGDRLVKLNQRLEENARSAQKGVVERLRGKYNYRSFWISNNLHIADATQDLIVALASRDEVKFIDKEEVFQLDYVKLDAPIIRRKLNADEDAWGIAKIRVPEAAELIKQGNANTNAIIVGTIDTGVRHTHKALRDNWVGPEYGWYDPISYTKEPHDNQGHGTHTMGTICGAGGIGVFPQAKWMSCTGCEADGCTGSALLKCMEFMLCPTLPNGKEKDCEKAPHVLSNSWGGPGGYRGFDDAIQALQTGGVTVLFSNGNSGPECRSVASPADGTVIGVGATTASDKLASFSSRGPAKNGLIKPDISAPGHSIFSSVHTADDAYTYMSGTSMACPHAAGLVAMLLSVKPELSLHDVESVLKRGAVTNLSYSGSTCGGIPDNAFPNNHFGGGRIDAFNSVKILLDQLK